MEVNGAWSKMIHYVVSLLSDSPINTEDDSAPSGRARPARYSSISPLGRVAPHCLSAGGGPATTMTGWSASNWHRSRFGRRYDRRDQLRGLPILNALL
jgi:hypothetical protein